MLRQPSYAVYTLFYSHYIYIWDVPPTAPHTAIFILITHRASEAAAQCIVIAPDCLCVFVCLWDCYHDNSKLRESNLTKLGLQVKVVTISSWLNFGRPAPTGRGSAVVRNFWQCLRLLQALFFHSTSKRPMSLDRLTIPTDFGPHCVRCDTSVKVSYRLTSKSFFRKNYRRLVSAIL